VRQARGGAASLRPRGAIAGRPESTLSGRRFRENERSRPSNRRKEGWCGPHRNRDRCLNVSEKFGGG